MSKSESSDNVYKKLQRCRADLKKLPIKPTGNNKFAGYTYMELGDFLPSIVDLCDEYGLCPVVCFGPEIATLIIYNIHNPEDKVVFTSPMSTAALKGCHEVQNLGAVETYIKRYLFTHAFDIVEHDALDSTHGKQEMTKSALTNRLLDTVTGDSSTGKTPAAEPDKKDEIPEFSTLLSFDELREKILATEALPHLKNVWVKYKADVDKLSVDEKKRLTAVKDEKKKELSIIKTTETAEEVYE